MRFMGFMLFLGLLMAILPGALFSQGNTYIESTITVPADLALPEGSLPKLRESFMSALDWTQQVNLTVMVTKVTNSKKKYDVLYDIATADIRNAVSTTNTSTQARVIAISNLALSQDSKYFEGLINILTIDKLLPTRIAASRSISILATNAPKKDKDYAVDRMIQLLNDPQKYNYQNFNSAAKQDKLFEDDRAAEAIVITLGDIGDPKAFGTLLNIVTVKNHRDETVQAAWDAMKKLKWY